VTRCYDCRANVAEGRWRCDACLTQFQDRAVLESVRGIHGTRGIGGAKVHLSAAERKSIERLTGVNVWDAQDARRACKATNMRPLEKGEELDDTINRQQAGESVPFPGWDKLGAMKAPPKFNFEERLAFHEGRLGR
jgi:hypothetical protein